MGVYLVHKDGDGIEVRSHFDTMLEAVSQARSDMGEDGQGGRNILRITDDGGNPLLNREGIEAFE